MPFTSGFVVDCTTINQAPEGRHRVLDQKFEPIVIAVKNVLCCGLDLTYSVRLGDVFVCSCGPVLGYAVFFQFSVERSLADT